jgi:hypothetical protein
LTVSVISSSQIKLVWMDKSSNELGFKIERSTGASTTFIQIATLSAGVTSYTNTGLTASTKYNYRVRSYNAIGNSLYTPVASATTSRPTSPTGLTLGPITADQIWLKWKDNSDNEAGFKIERSTGTSTIFTQIATVGAGVTTYGNVGLKMSTKYNYRVWAYNGIGTSSFYAAASGTTTGIASAQKAEEATASNNLKASLYPNPVTNSLTVNLREASTEITATVSDIKGSVFIVKNYTVADQRQFKLDVHALKPGSYFLRIKTVEGMEVLKFIKF